jgi:hypothetical protein
LERSNDEANRTCLCFDAGVIRASHAARAPSTAKREDHYCSRSMWGGYAHGERYLRENTRPARHQQMCSRSDLLDPERLVVSDGNTADKSRTAIVTSICSELDHGGCLLWVRSGHRGTSEQCPLSITLVRNALTWIKPALSAVIAHDKAGVKFPDRDLQQHLMAIRRESPQKRTPSRIRARGCSQVTTTSTLGF